MEYSNTSKQLKNLARVAMEIAGKGQGLEGKNGEPLGDDIETTDETQETSVTQTECVECEAEKIVEEITQHILKLQESLDFELSEDAINFAIDLYLEQNIPGRDVGSSEPTRTPSQMRIPGREVGQTDHHHTDGVNRDRRGKLETFLRNLEAGYIRRKYEQAQNVINPPGTPPEERIPVTRSEVMSDILRTAANRMQDDITP